MLLDLPFQQARKRLKSASAHTFNDFAGQAQVVENLKVFVQAAKLRNEALDHVLCMGRQD